MNTTIPDHFQTQFDTNFKNAVQQNSSRLQKAAIVTNGCKGEAKTHNLILPLDDNETTGERYGKTVLRDLSTAKRWNTIRTFDNTSSEPKWDETLLAPTIMPNGSHIQTHRSAHARRMDSVFIQGAFGTNSVGVDGSDKVEIPDSNIIPVDHTAPGVTATNSALTIEKIIEGTGVLADNDSYGDDQMEAGISLWGCMTPKMEKMLLYLANASTGNSGNRLFSREFLPPVLDERGHIKYFLGVNWIRSTRLLKDEDDPTIQYAGIWTSDAIHLDIWQDIQSKVSIREDMKYAVQFYTDYAMNACRSEDKKVVKIACDITGL